MKNTISIFQIYYDERSEQHLDPDLIPYKNENRDDLFENSVIRKLHEEPHNLGEYIGITSWKMNGKTNLTGKELIDHIENDIKGGTEKDVYIYCPLTGIEPTYDLSVDPPILRGIIKSHDIWHGHKRRIHPFKIDEALNNSGVLPFNLFDGKWKYCYNNFWVAKWHIFNEYCENILIPAMDFISSQDFPKTYKHSSGQSYTHACFTLEGLFGAFLAHKNYTFDYIFKQKIRRQFHNIKVDDYQITNES